MMLCVISYWVLSGAKRRQIQQLRCCVLPTKLLKRRDVYLKLTRHNGRAGSHGTYTPSTAIYSQMDYMLKAGGLTNFHVGTIEGYPTFDTMLAQLKAGKAKRVTLIPFMFVAGDHAKNDIAGEWKEMLEKEGFTVSAQLEGLGQIPEIQEIFIDHIRFGLKHRMLDIMTKKAAYAAGKDTE